MIHLQNWFGLLPPDIATILPWPESLDEPLTGTVLKLVVLDSSETNALVSPPLNSNNVYDDDNNDDDVIIGPS